MEQEAVRSRERLESTLLYLAHMVSLREGGDVYIPIFERIEAEIAELDRERDRILGVRARAAELVRRARG